MIELQPLMKIKVTLEPVRDLGETPLGRRRIIGITGGSFAGPGLSGKVLPGGADWQLIRSDGVAFLDARYTLETTDGALIYVSNKGYRHGPKEVIERLAKGEEVDPALYYMRTTPWFETAAAHYAWLNRAVCVATGARRAAAVELDFYEVK
jgi:5-methylphenazine-1-carboxylate 1-monooxygenase